MKRWNPVNILVKIMDENEISRACEGFNGGE